MDSLSPPFPSSLLCALCSFDWGALFVKWLDDCMSAVLTASVFVSSRNESVRGSSSAKLLMPWFIGFPVEPDGVPVTPSDTLTTSSFPKTTPSGAVSWSAVFCSPSFRDACCGLSCKPLLHPFMWISSPHNLEFELSAIPASPSSSLSGDSFVFGGSFCSLLVLCLDGNSSSFDDAFSSDVFLAAITKSN